MLVVYASNNCIYCIISGYSAQAVYHTEISDHMLRNQLEPVDDYTTDKSLIYAVLIEQYFTLGRALMAEKKSVSLFRR